MCTIPLRRCRPATDWRADAYRRFEAQRTRPAVDLLARVPERPRQRIVDLGCGPGNSTALLAERTQAALVRLGFVAGHVGDGADASAATEVRTGDIAVWREPPADLVFANAVLQWAPATSA